MLRGSGCGLWGYENGGNECSIVAVNVGISDLRVVETETKGSRYMPNMFTVSYPEQIPNLLLETREQFETEARKAMAVKLFEMKRLSSGMAAMMAGMERKQFLMSLHLYGVPMINLEEDEFFEDIQNA